MNAINQWCKNKPPAIRMPAKIVAFSPPDIRRALDPNLQNKLPSSWQHPRNPKHWCACYKSSRQIRASLFAMLFEGHERTGAKLYHLWNLSLTRSVNIRMLAMWNGLSEKRRASAMRFGNWLCRIFEASLDRQIQKMLKPAKSYSMPRPKMPLEPKLTVPHKPVPGCNVRRRSFMISSNNDWLGKPMRATIRCPGSSRALLAGFSTSIKKL